ncbi:class I SAM-dependent methyltransferase [Pseudomonas zhanjiangensis]|uniref:Class I SAM-dependent methyltransferase n=1 Tax=Pseudomonas zhanjiangensis TaxID=3239015 RepID=A0ABV3YU18_9PSED
MTCPQPLIRLRPITSGAARGTPRILLGGSHQPTLLRQLDGWPMRREGSQAFLIQFADELESLARFASDSFDMAVVQAPRAEDLHDTLRELTRIARQGLITRR